MSNAYNQLKNELSIRYPDVTDIELNEITNNLIDFYTTAVKAVLEDKTNKFAIDGKNSSS